MDHTTAADTRVEVDLERNSPYRVTLELALMIARAEKKDFGVAGTPGNRDYWLNLYSQCRQLVVKGTLPQNVIKGKGSSASGAESSLEPDAV